MQTIPIPSSLEQRRIVAEIEMQFTWLEAGVAALKRAQTNLRRYKVSVLTAACEGRSVPTEAELARAEGRDYESADKLLQRILAQRRIQTTPTASTQDTGHRSPPSGDPMQHLLKPKKSPAATPPPRHNHGVLSPPCMLRLSFQLRHAGRKDRRN